MSETPEPRKGMPSPRLDEAEFKRRFLAQYVDPAFDFLEAELAKVAEAAWQGYSNHRKAPRTHKVRALDLWSAFSARHSLAYGEGQREYGRTRRPPNNTGGGALASF